MFSNERPLMPFNLAKFISLVVQISTLAVLAIITSFRNLCLTAKENHVA